MAIGQIFIAPYPNVMISSSDHAFNLTVNSASSRRCALFVMTVVAGIILPIVLLYQGWSFRGFRGRVSAPASAPFR